MGLQKRGKQRNVSTNKTGSLVVGHTKHGIFPWAQGAFSACLKRSKDSWKRHAKWKRRNHQKNCEGRQICINISIYIYMHTHGVSSSASSETTDIFHLRGFLKLFLIYFTICPSPILQAEWFEHWRREVYCPDEDHTQLMLDHHSFSISKLEVCPNKSKLSQFDDIANELSSNWMKRMPPGVGFHPMHRFFSVLFEA